MLRAMAEGMGRLVELQSQSVAGSGDAARVMAENLAKLAEMQSKNFETDGGGKRSWDHVDKFRNIKIFTGDSKEWDEFSAKLRSQIAAGDRKGLAVMEEGEKGMSERDVENEDWDQIVEPNVDEKAVESMSAKLHNVLLSITTGEANAVVRRCRGNGLWAWKRLSTTLNPRTLASGVKAISMVLNPGKIANGAKADVMIEVWEDRMAKLLSEYGEEISGKMKVAVLYAMLPKDLQERVLDKCTVNWDAGKSDQEAAKVYTQVRDEVKNIAKSRREMITPKPMDVDEVKAGWEEGGDEDQGDEDHNINFVGKGKGKGKCWTCGEVGHRAAECQKGGWNNKGKGKGMQFGKGGAWNEYSKGAKGGVTPMPRACFGCGSTSHLLKDCPSKVTHKVQEVRDDEEDVEILFIGHTEAVELNKWETVKGRWSTKNLEKIGKPPGLEDRSTNKFKVLEVDEEDDEICHVCTVEDCRVGKSKVTDNPGKVEKKKVWASLGVGDIVVDSAADESCWPKGQGDAFETKPSRKCISLRTANGGEMGHYGEKEITFRSGGDDEIVGLKFQVTDVKKPLLAVRRLVERGNVVSFGPEPSQNFIQNLTSGKKIMMEKHGGAFIIRANFVKEVAGFPRQA